MATFSFTKKFGDVEKVALLPDDWYRVRLVKDPKLVPNSIKKNKGDDAEGAGDNIMLTLRVQSENPKHHGRSFFVRLPVPSPNDEDKVDEIRGMTVEDVKLQRISKWAAAFMSIPEDQLADVDEVEFEPGSEAMVYIDTKENWISNPPEGEEYINNIDTFNTVPRSVE